MIGKRYMVWRGWETDQTVDCYLAGVEARCKGHPDQSPAYARKQAVAVILAAKVKLRIEEEKGHS